jgi:hypothetical protein
MSNPSKHMKMTAKLAKKLSGRAIYNWIMTDGYYPESYVLPPCFAIKKYPPFGKIYFPKHGRQYNPKSSNLAQIQFPKSNYADRTFSVIDPEIHCDIVYEIAMNWKKLLRVMFSPNNHVCSYSFPVPLDSKKLGVIGRLRSGRMIYEFIEMAENDVATESYQYSFLIRADIKNFYATVYTHSLAWAIHSMPFIRSKARRHNYQFLGNRIDKLFQRSNDDRTNGIPIGPVVSDVVSEILLARVDTAFSKLVATHDCLAVRFKDDYRILCHTESSAKLLAATGVLTTVEER